MTETTNTKKRQLKERDESGVPGGPLTGRDNDFDIFAEDYPEDGGEEAVLDGGGRPENGRDDHDADGTQTRVLADPEGYAAEGHAAEGHAAGQNSGHPDELDDDEEDDDDGEHEEGEEDEGEGGGARRVIAIALLCVVGVFLGFTAIKAGLNYLYGDDDQAQGQESGAGQGQAKASGQAGSSDPTDTKITYTTSKADSDGNVSLEKKGGEGKDSGGSWTGKVTQEKDKKGNQIGESVELSGPTFGQFKSGFQTGVGYQTTGDYGVVTSSGLFENVSYHRHNDGKPDSKDPSPEVAGGTYYIESSKALLVSGDFTDVRSDGGKGDEVTRTYVDRDPKTAEETTRYSVKFKAAPKSQIPDLPGYKEPSAS